MFSGWVVSLIHHIIGPMVADPLLPSAVKDSILAVWVLDTLLPGVRHASVSMCVGACQHSVTFLCTSGERGTQGRCKGRHTTFEQSMTHWALYCLVESLCGVPRCAQMASPQVTAVGSSHHLHLHSCHDLLVCCEQASSLLTPAVLPIASVLVLPGVQAVVPDQHGHSGVLAVEYATAIPAASRRCSHAPHHVSKCMQPPDTHITCPSACSPRIHLLLCQMGMVLCLADFARGEGAKEAVLCWWDMYSGLRGLGRSLLCSVVGQYSGATCIAACHSTSSCVSFVGLVTQGGAQQ